MIFFQLIGAFFLCVLFSAAQDLSVPLVLRVDGQMRLTPAKLLVRTEVFDARISKRGAAARPVAEYLWFQRFLATAAGPQPDNAEKSVSTKTESANSVSPKGLVTGYKSLLANGNASILFAIQRSDARIYFWMTEGSGPSGARFAASTVAAEGSSYAVSPPDSGDGLTYLILRGLDWQSKQVAGAAALDALQQDLPGSGSLLAVEDGLKLWVPELQLGVETKLACEAPSSAPAMLAGCWLRTFFNPGGYLPYMSAKGKASAAQWISSLSAAEIKQLRLLHDRPALRSNIFNLDGLSIVFPQLGSPVLGNKASIYVLRQDSALTVVNFFSADFADTILAKASQLAQSAPANRK